MARPRKHPDSGVYWFRKGVPAPLREFVGKREEKVSLQTKDPAEARVRHGKVAADVAARWASLQASGPVPAAQPDVAPRSAFSEREAHEVARVFYDRHLEACADNQSKGFWKPEIGQTLWREVDYKLLWDSQNCASAMMSSARPRRGVPMRRGASRHSERALPVHSALLGAGLPAFVAGVKSGPLFADAKPDRFGRRGGNGTKVLSRRVRDQGLKDPRISPNQSWRHRFKTPGRRHGLASDIVDAITGHGRKTVADSYGEFELAALAREIEEIPRLQL